MTSSEEKPTHSKYVRTYVRTHTGIVFRVFPSRYLAHGWLVDVTWLVVLFRCGKLVNYWRLIPLWANRAIERVKFLVALFHCGQKVLTGI